MTTFSVAQALDEFRGHPAKFACTQWRCWMLGNYDGDTLTVRADVGFFDTSTKDVRVLGINAPELKTGTQASRARGLACKMYLQSIAPVGSALQLITTMAKDPQDPTEKYGRFLAQVTVWRADGTSFDLATAMLAFGHGVVAYNPT